MERLTTELAASREWVDEIESTLDVVMGMVDVPIVVVGDDRRIRAVSRRATELLGGDVVVGKPLSSIVSDDVYADLEAHFGAEAAGAARDADTGAGAGVRVPGGGVLAGRVDVEPLPGGGAVLAFRRDR